MRRRQFLPLLLAPVLRQSSVSAFEDQPEWPQWKGPDRNGISKETGLLKEWPSGGPRALWSISSMGEGYGSLAIKRDRVYVQGVDRGNSVVFSLDRRGGKTVWTTVLAGSLEQDRGSGPRGTPTLDGDRVYALAENGELACLAAQDGSVDVATAEGEGTTVTLALTVPTALKGRQGPHRPGGRLAPHASPSTSVR